MKLLLIEDEIKLAKFFNATISDFPSDEPKPDNTDILIILGKDRS